MILFNSLVVQPAQARLERKDEWACLKQILLNDLLMASLLKMDQTRCPSESEIVGFIDNFLRGQEGRKSSPRSSVHLEENSQTSPLNSILSNILLLPSEEVIQSTQDSDALINHLQSQLKKDLRPQEVEDPQDILSEDEKAKRMDDGVSLSQNVALASLNKIAHPITETGSLAKPEEQTNSKIQLDPLAFDSLEKKELRTEPMGRLDQDTLADQLDQTREISRNIVAKKLDQPTEVVEGQPLSLHLNLETSDSQKQQKKKDEEENLISINTPPIHHDQAGSNSHVLETQESLTPNRGSPNMRINSDYSVEKTLLSGLIEKLNPIDHTSHSNDSEVSKKIFEELKKHMGPGPQIHSKEKNIMDELKKHMGPGPQIHSEEKINLDELRKHMGPGPQISGPTIVDEKTHKSADHTVTEKLPLLSQTSPLYSSNPDQKVGRADGQLDPMAKDQTEDHSPFGEDDESLSDVNLAEHDALLKEIKLTDDFKNNKKLGNAHVVHSYKLNPEEQIEEPINQTPITKQPEDKQNLPGENIHPNEENRGTDVQEHLPSVKNDPNQFSNPFDPMLTVINTPKPRSTEPKKTDDLVSGDPDKIIPQDPLRNIEEKPTNIIKTEAPETIKEEPVNTIIQDNLDPGLDRHEETHDLEEPEDDFIEHPNPDQKPIGKHITKQKVPSDIQIEDQKPNTKTQTESKDQQPTPSLQDTTEPQSVELEDLPDEDKDVVNEFNEFVQDKPPQMKLLKVHVVKKKQPINDEKPIDNKMPEQKTPEKNEEPIVLPTHDEEKPAVLPKKEEQKPVVSPTREEQKPVVLLSKDEEKPVILPQKQDTTDPNLIDLDEPTEQDKELLDDFNDFLSTPPKKMNKLHVVSSKLLVDNKEAIPPIVVPPIHQTQDEDKPDEFVIDGPVDDTEPLDSPVKPGTDPKKKIKAIKSTITGIPETPQTNKTPEDNPEQIILKDQPEESEPFIPDLPSRNIIKTKVTKITPVINGIPNQDGNQDPNGPTIQKHPEEIKPVVTEIIPTIELEKPTDIVTPINNQDEIEDPFNQPLDEEDPFNNEEKQPKKPPAKHIIVTRFTPIPGKTGPSKPEQTPTQEKGKDIPDSSKKDEFKNPPNNVIIDTVPITDPETKEVLGGSHQTPLIPTSAIVDPGTTVVPVDEGEKPTELIINTTPDKPRDQEKPIIIDTVGKLISENPEDDEELPITDVLNLPQLPGKFNIPSTTVTDQPDQDENFEQPLQLIIQSYHQKQEGYIGKTIFANQLVRMLNGETLSDDEVVKKLVMLFDLLPACVQNAISVCRSDPSATLDSLRNSRSSEYAAHGKIFGLKCNADEEFFNGACYAKCPPGFTDFKLYCKKPEYKPRSVQVFNEAMRENFENYSAELAVEKCTAEQASRAGPNFCRFSCPLGWKDFGQLCRKPARFRNQDLFLTAQVLIK